MDLNSQFLFFFSAIGVFNGMLLSLFCLFFNKEHILSRYLFGLVLLAMCLRNAKSVMIYFNQAIEYPWLLQIGQTASFLIGPLLFSFTYITIKQKNELNLWLKLLLATSIAIVIIVSVLQPVGQFYDFWRDSSRAFVHGTLFLFILLSAGVLLDELLKKGVFYLHDRWTLLVLLSNVIVGIGYILALWTNTYALGPLMFSIVFYGILIYFIAHFREVNLLFKHRDKYSANKILDEDAEELISRLNTLMAEKHLYRKPTLRMSDLARELDIPKHQLSVLLNDNLGKRFSQYINEYRIHAACIMLTSGSQFTLEGIGHEVGFGSKSSFFTAFKKMIGKTPKEFLISHQRN